MQKTRPTLSAERVFILRSSGSELFYCVGHQSDVTSSLYSYGDCSLMLCAGTGYTTRKDLTSLGNVLTQLCGILVIDSVVLTTEYANLFSSTAAASLHLRVGSIRLIKYLLILVEG